MGRIAGAITAGGAAAGYCAASCNNNGVPRGASIALFGLIGAGAGWLGGTLIAGSPVRSAAATLTTSTARSSTGVRPSLAESIHSIRLLDRQPWTKPKVAEVEGTPLIRVLLCTKKCLVVVAMCIFTFAMTGCIESTFNLASESRLPKGVTIPPGLTRADVSVTLDFMGIKQARFTLRDKNGKKLATVTGEAKGDPVYLTTTPRGTGTGYQLVVINGVTEIMECIPYREHANMVQNGRIVALFYVVDDLP